MKSTIKDVAREAGVSTATVSRVLNRKDRVSENTRKAVELAIKKLNFQPDQAARTMVMNESKLVGLIIPNLSNEYWAMLTEVIQRELRNYGYAVILCMIGEDESSFEKEIEALKLLVDRKADGIICHAPSKIGQDANGQIKEFNNYGIPVVTFEQKVPGINQVYGDHIQGAMLAVNHLFELGHTQIAFIGGFLDVPERELGYRNAHFLKDLPVNEKIVKHIPPSLQEGYRAALELLHSGERFTAVFCWNDMIAFGAIQAIEDFGLKVPEDIAVVGYDDIVMAGMFKPTLTTIRQPIKEIGVSVVQLLVESIKSGNTANYPRNVVVEMKLIVRESSGAHLGISSI